MNPFIFLRNLFLGFFTTCVNVALDIDAWYFGPAFLANFFYTMADWCWDIATWFGGAAGWWEDVQKAIAEILDVFDIEEIISGLRSALADVWAWWVSWVANVQGVVTTWWSAVQDTVKAWIATAKSSLIALINILWDLHDAVEAWRDDFVLWTLPKLLNLDWVAGFFGAGIAAIRDWWDPQHQVVSQETEAVVKPVRDTVNEHSNWLDLVKELFTDPASFFLRMIERMVVELW